MGLGIRHWIAASLAVALGLYGVAYAQTYPNKAIRFVVGPGPDVLARIIGQKLTDTWGQQVVVDQRPGAGGIIAADTVAKASPDGYTLLLSTGAYSVNQALYPKLPYNLERDLAPVALLATISFLILANPALPAKTLDELIQLAKAKPGSLNCASSGLATTPHMGCEMLKANARIDIVHVPYKGIGPALIDVMSGQAHMMFAVMQGGLPHVRAGKLRALAVTGPKRSAAAPDVATVAEQGLPGVQFISWNGVHATARTPRDVIVKLSAELIRTAQQPEVRDRMLALGLDPTDVSPAQFAAFVKDDIASWARVIKATGVRAE